MTSISSFSIALPIGNVISEPQRVGTIVVVEKPRTKTANLLCAKCKGTTTPQGYREDCQNQPRPKLATKYCFLGRSSWTLRADLDFRWCAAMGKVGPEVNLHQWLP